VDQTYKLTGTAVGFNTEHPFARTRNSFNIKVAC
ncbi:MAG TPA: lipoprotein LpqH, partial [Mycobacterium sp.]|nr:lipoprotein LpqH [Mycobacterium sp.]